MAGDKVLKEFRIQQPGFTYSACGLFTKHREKVQKFREAVI